MNRVGSLPSVNSVSPLQPLTPPQAPTASMAQTQSPAKSNTSEKNDLSGEAAMATTAAAVGAGIFTAAFLPMWIYLALMLVIFLILLWCIRNIAVDSKGKSVKDTAKYQAVALISVLLFGIGAGTAYYLNKMCREESNPAVMWGIAVASPIILVFLLAYLVKLILGSFYYTLSYAYGYDDKAKQKELEAIAAAAVATPAAQPALPAPPVNTVPNVRPAGPG